MIKRNLKYCLAYSHINLYWVINRSWLRVVAYSPEGWWSVQNRRAQVNTIGAMSPPARRRGTWGRSHVHSRVLPCLLPLGEITDCLQSQIQIYKWANLPIIATTSANMWPSEIWSRAACTGRNNSLFIKATSRVEVQHVKLLALEKLEENCHMITWRIRHLPNAQSQELLSCTCKVGWCHRPPDKHQTLPWMGKKQVTLFAFAFVYCCCCTVLTNFPWVV